MAPHPAGMVESALYWARRGIAVFPCNPKAAGQDSKRPLVPRDRDEQGNPIPKSGGFYNLTKQVELAAQEARHTAANILTGIAAVTQRLERGRS